MENFLFQKISSLFICAEKAMPRRVQPPQCLLPERNQTDIPRLKPSNTSQKAQCKRYSSVEKKLEVSRSAVIICFFFYSCCFSQQCLEVFNRWAIIKHRCQRQTCRTLKRKMFRNSYFLCSTTF